MPMNALSIGSLFANHDFIVEGAAAAINAPIEAPVEPTPAWLEDLQITVSGLSLEPMKGSDVFERMQSKTKDVLCRFLPCVDFLVACQQDLRKGLMYATQKRLIRRAYRDTLTPKQFYSKYVAPLPQRFLMANQRLMEANQLREAFDEVQKLSAQARAVERQGCEVMKNTFLGGMKDGESWGLRKWLSKHGGALQICTDLELILTACQKLNKELDSTKKLSALMRPLAKKALGRLRSDVPQSYQEVSTAHPYLPFFHRLEAALRSMSNFDPEDDDVICLDDSDDDDDDIVEVKRPAYKKSAAAKPKATPKVVAKASLKRAPSISGSADKHTFKRARGNSPKMMPISKFAGAVVKDNDGDSDDSDSDIEIVGFKPGIKTNGEDSDQSEAPTGAWSCSGCSTENDAGVAICGGCKMSRDFMNDLLKFPAFEDVMNVKTGLSDNEDNDDEDILGGNPFDFGGVGDSKKSVDDFLAGRPIMESSPIRKRTVIAPPIASPPSFTEAIKLATDLDSLADVFEIGQHTNIRPRNAPVQAGAFWDGVLYGSSLRLLSQLLRMPESVHFLDPVDINDPKHVHPPYLSVIKNPICLRDIVSSLIPDTFNCLEFESGRDGILNQDGLSFWNMWCGQDLLQAVDLVFLNSLAYGKIGEGGRSSQRTETNRLRKKLWSGLHEIITDQVGTNKDLQKQHAPTKRGETSGFVIHKNSRR